MLFSSFASCPKRLNFSVKLLVTIVVVKLLGAFWLPTEQTFLAQETSLF